MGRLRKDFKKRLLSNLGSRSQAAGESVSLKQSSRHSGRWEQRPDHGHISVWQLCKGSQALIKVQAVRGSLGRGPGGGGHFKLHSMRTLDCQGAGGPSVHGREVGRDLERTRAHVSDK